MKPQNPILAAFALLLYTLVATSLTHAQEEGAERREVDPQRVEQRLNSLEMKIADLDRQTDELVREFGDRLERIDRVRGEVSSELSVLTTELLGEDSAAAQSAAAQIVLLNNPHEVRYSAPAWSRWTFSLLMAFISLASIGFIVKIFFARWGAEDAVELLEQTSGYEIRAAAVHSEEASSETVDSEKESSDSE